MDHAIQEARKAKVELEEYDARKLNFWLGWKLTQHQRDEWQVPVNAERSSEKIIPSYCDPRNDVIM
jgi:hypothetical protein